MTESKNAVALTAEQIDAIMEQAQVFASAWSLVGGIFDSGNALETAEQEKANLRALLATPIEQAVGVRDAWQPIETAPKTGRTLLLGYLNIAGKWRTVRGQWMSESYIAEYWEEPDDVEPGWFETSEEADDVPNCWRIEPTHWMPLPKAPSNGDQE